MRRTTNVLAVLALLVMAGSCGSSDEPVTTGGTGPTAGSTNEFPDTPEGRLTAAEQRWSDAGIADYEMTYQVQCFCPQLEVTVVVAGGEIADTTSRDPSADASSSPPWESVPLTVEDMFDEIQAAYDSDAAEVQVSYDPTDGHPFRYWVDQEAEMADEEQGIEVVSFAVSGDPIDPTSVAPTPSVVTTGTTQPAANQAVATADLTESWGCGYGFAASNPEQTVGLVLTRVDNEPPAADELTVDLSGPSWQGQVWVGTNLFANWCNDVIDGSQLTSQVDETWPVVAGTLTIVPPTGTACSSDVIVAATVEDLTVVASNGSSITHQPLELTNDAWGCFAG